MSLFIRKLKFKFLDGKNSIQLVFNQKCFGTLKKKPYKKTFINTNLSFPT
jgi:hypothetical protein